jgi:hypothetical protein
MPIAFGSSQSGFALAELQAALTASVARILTTMREQTEDPSTVTGVDFARALYE